MQGTLEQSQCLICQKATQPKELLSFAKCFPQESYKIVECPFCSTKRTWPPTENVRALYQSNAWMDRPPKSLFYFLKGFLIRHEIRRICRHTGLKEILDLGAGFGDFSANAHRLGCSVVSSDASSARPYYISSLKDIPYVHFNYEDYTIEEPRVVRKRVIVLRHVLEHIERPKDFLSQLKSYQPEFFYIVVPNFNRFEKNVFKEFDILWGMPQHLWHFDKRSLTFLLTELGLKIVATGYETIPVAMPSILNYLNRRKYPEFIRRFLGHNVIFYGLSLLLSIVFPHNVIWMIAKVE